MPPIPTPLGAFESGSIFDIHQPYLEAIPSIFHVLRLDYGGFGRIW